VGAFSLDHAGIDGVDPDLLRAQLAGEHAGDGVNRALGAGVNHAVRRCDATGYGADVNDAGAFAEVLDGCLRGKQKTEHVNVKCLVELVFGDGLDGGELVHAGVVNQDVEPAVVFDGGVDDTVRLSSFGDVASHGNGFATRLGDSGDNVICSCFALCVVYDHRCAFRGECLRDGCPDAFGCARDDCDFTCEFAHVFSLFCVWSPQPLKAGIRASTTHFLACPIERIQAAHSKRVYQVLPLSSGGRERRLEPSNMAGLPGSPFAPRP
jgi:hypothetical protein